MVAETGDWPIPCRHASHDVDNVTTFAEALRTSQCAVTAQLPLTPDSDAESIARDARLLGPMVDAITVPDNQFGHVHMSSVAGAALVIGEGCDAIVELSCRNRNRIALLGDLLGARAIGASTVSIIRGRKAPGEIASQPKFVLDIGAKELIALARRVRDDQTLSASGGFAVGGVATVHDPTDDWIPQRLSEKIDSGAQFIQTQLCFDAELVRRYLARLVEHRITQRAQIVVATGILPSAEGASALREDQPHVIVPDAVIARLRSAADPLREGTAICAELIAEFASVPGVSGISVVPGPNVAAAAEAIARSGVRPSV